MLYFSLENEESKPFRQRLTSVGVSPFGFGKNVNLVFDDEGTAFLESHGDFLACYTKDGIVHRLAQGDTGRQLLHVMALSSECDYSMAERTGELKQRNNG